MSSPRLRRVLAGLGPAQGSFGLDLFRWLLVACLGTTIWLTWPLWQTRATPPLLPLGLPLPQLDLGYPLLVALVAALVHPLGGTLLLSALVALAMLLDQTRLQPQIFSMVLLLWSCLRWSSVRTLARAHLLAMWFWAGLHKLISVGYYAQFPPFVAYAIFGQGVVPREWLTPMGVVIALSESALALGMLSPRLRKPTVLLALAIHTMILFALLSVQWNSSVWAWNVAVVGGAFALFWRLENPTLALLRVQPRWLQLAIVFLLVSPAGFYAGLVDAYLAHCLYSYNNPEARIAGPGGRYERIDPRPALNVPIPPEHRLFEQYFRLVGRPGDVLAIDDPRLGAKLRGVDRRLLQLGADGRLIDRSEERRRSGPSLPRPTR